MLSKYIKTITKVSAPVILIFSLTITGLQAKKATLDEMDLTCRNHLSLVVFDRGSWAGEVNPKIDRVDNLIVNDTLLARCYNIAPQGFVIVPALRDLPPIQAYSEEGFLNVNDTTGFPRLVRDFLQNRVQNFISQYGSMEASLPDTGDMIPGRSHRRAWDIYTRSESVFIDELNKDFLSPTDTTVGPLLTTSWDQFAPYNNYCPIGCWNQRTVVGCVATAMAQLMAYYKWPPEGYGSKYFQWSGDYSCDGCTPTPSQYLLAEFNDPYDWANIPDNCNSGCTTEQQAALAELNYEVGVACSMNYGVCGSGANPDTLTLANYFRYRNNIKIKERRDYGTNYSWYLEIVDEIDAGRPVLYYIDLHAIVCDGYKDEMGILLYYHMNYGWGGDQNTWFVIDDLYCPWGCYYLNEYMFTNIIPDSRVTFTADTNYGWAPLEVNFEGATEHDSVFSWTWYFGDGTISHEQSPTHIYNTSGLFDVLLKVTDKNYHTDSCPKQDYIFVLADTLIGGSITGPKDSTLEITISATNSPILSRLDIPVEFGGPLNVSYLGYSLEGCRTEDFEYVSYLNYNSTNKCLCLSLEAGTALPLMAGSGPVLKLRFKINSADSGLSNPIITDGYSSFLPRFYASQAQYQPKTRNGSLTYSGCCIGFVGNTDCSPDESPDITDITRIIDFLYLSGKPLCCPDEADVDRSGGYPLTDPDITDITRLIDHLYLLHTPLPDCP